MNRVTKVLSICWVCMAAIVLCTAFTQENTTSIFIVTPETSKDVEEELIRELVLLDPSANKFRIEELLNALKDRSSGLYCRGLVEYGIMRSVMQDFDSAMESLTTAVAVCEDKSYALLPLSQVAIKREDWCCRVFSILSTMHFSESDYASRLARARIELNCKKLQRTIDTRKLAEIRAEEAFGERRASYVCYVEEMVLADIALVGGNKKAATEWLHRATESISQEAEAVDALVRAARSESRIPGWYGLRVDAVGLLFALRNNDMLDEFSESTAGFLLELITNLRKAVLNKKLELPEDVAKGLRAMEERLQELLQVSRSSQS